MILVDSSVWADFFNGYPSPEEIKLKTLLDSRADIAITGIIASEVLSGFKDERTFEEVKETFLNYLKLKSILITIFKQLKCIELFAQKELQLGVLLTA